MLEDITLEDYLLLEDDNGRIIYSVLKIFPSDGLHLHSVEFVYREKIENVIGLTFDSIRSCYQYIIIKKDEVT